MATKIHPLSGYVAAEAEEAKDQTASGFYLPQNAAEKPKTAVVVAVGGQVQEVKVGDRIVYRDYGPVTLKVDGKEMLLIKEDDILATVK